MKSEADEKIRYSLRELLIVTTYIQVSLAVAFYLNSVVIGIHLSLALLGWMMWRYAHGHLGGIIPALVGGDILLCSSVQWVLSGEEDLFGLRGLFCIVASLCVAAGFFVLLWVAARRPRFWKHQIGIAVFLLLAMCTWWAIIPSIGNAAIARRRAVDIAANIKAMEKAIAMATEAQKLHGETPDKETLLKILGGPLPSVRWDGNSQEIQYNKVDETSFQLTFIDPSVFWGDMLIYFSESPAQGWVKAPF
ncbi:MAG: hypothetical protein MUC83_18015 [Pirellula sp.]|jgi:hypothetical protein|nr:hypothetical protein [Pirellula sp.]